MASSGALSILHNPEKIRRLSMQSLFESLETLCEGTVIVDRDARIVWINERYATRLGAKSAAEAIGKPVEEVIRQQSDAFGGDQRTADPARYHGGRRVRPSW